MIDFGVSMQEIVLPPRDLVRRNDIIKSASFGPTEKEIKLDIPTVINDNIKILNKIPLPENIQKAELERVIEKIIKEDLEKDTLFKMASDLAKYASDFRSEFSRYFSRIFDYHKEVVKRLDRELFHSSNLFLNSDLSPSFLKSLALSILTEMKTVELVDKRMRREHMQFLTVRNNSIKFSRMIDGHNAWVDPLIQALDDMVENRVALFWYLDFQNSTSIDRLFKPKYINRKNLDQETFYSLLFSLQKSTRRLRKIVVGYDKEVFLSAIPAENPTFKLFSSMIQLTLHA